MVRLTRDASPGVHCMLFAACDPARYRLLGCTGPHDNCADNLREAIASTGVALAYVPTPLNLFMNTKLDDDRVMRVEAPEAKAGDSVTFEALVDCVVAMSACPQDLVPVNGVDCTPKGVEFFVGEG
ncbi:MAG TPA: urea carboxylase-associated family protein [Burkholderiales bacterium]|nr:urea carboxylase-associated family protein [Burkholderiales bacterium]